MALDGGGEDAGGSEADQAEDGVGIRGAGAGAVFLEVGGAVEIVVAPAVFEIGDGAGARKVGDPGAGGIEPAAEIQIVFIGEEGDPRGDLAGLGPRGGDGRGGVGGHEDEMVAAPAGILGGDVEIAAVEGGMEFEAMLGDPRGGIVAHAVHGMVADVGRQLGVAGGEPKSTPGTGGAGGAIRGGGSRGWCRTGFGRG